MWRNNRWQKNSAGTVLATTAYTVGASTYGSDSRRHLVAAKTDPDGHAYAYGYDANGDLTSLTTPLGRQTQWGYDGLGTKTSRTDAMSRTTSYTLDGWERTASETYPDASSKTFSYDADGDVTGFVDPTGTTARTYDADGRLLAESKGGSAIVSHAYDASGQLGLLSSTTDAGGRTLTYAYTGRDQLASVSEAAGTTSYAYDADENETAITNGNGTTVAKVYDSAGRLSSVTNKAASGTTLSSFAYQYNADSLKTGVTEADGSQVTYGYDGLLHLSSEVRTGTAPYSMSYVVDGAGDRQSQTTNGVTTTLTYDADDELLSTSGGFVNSYGYNANGDQTSRTLSGTSYALSYDYDDQLTSTGGASFAYDAAGRRVSRTAGGVTTSFLYDGESVLLEQQGGATTATYSYGNALTRKDGETPLFDGQGSERTVTNAGGAVQATLTLTAFGQAEAPSRPSVRLVRGHTFPPAVGLDGRIRPALTPLREKRTHAQSIPRKTPGKPALLPMAGAAAGRLQWEQETPTDRSTPLPSANFPLTFHLVHHLPTNSYGCVYAGGVRGLACFTDAADARRFARRMETRQNLIVEMAMADACEVAAQSLVPALVLGDDERAPLVHPLSAQESCP